MLLWSHSVTDVTLCQKCCAVSLRSQILNDITLCQWCHTLRAKSNSATVATLFYWCDTTDVIFCKIFQTNVANVIKLVYVQFCEKWRTLVWKNIKKEEKDQQSTIDPKYEHIPTIWWCVCTILQQMVNPSAKMSNEEKGPPSLIVQPCTLPQLLLDFAMCTDVQGGGHIYYPTQ